MRSARSPAYLDNYDLGMAAQRCNDFIWDDFCDWFVEMAKMRLYDGTDEERGRGKERALRRDHRLDEAAASVHALRHRRDRLLSARRGKHHAFVLADGPRHFRRATRPNDGRRDGDDPPHPQHPQRNGRRARRVDCVFSCAASTPRSRLPRRKRRSAALPPSATSPGWARTIKSPKRASPS